ncbi:MAG: FAD-binding oxidoreductase [Rhizobiaceae bacterium]
MARQQEVTVLGAGIVGVCCALSLIERGFRVTLVDRSEPGEGASHGNAGVISPWSCVPQCLPGTWRNVPKWLLQSDGPVRFRFSYLPTFLPWAASFLANGTDRTVNEIADVMDRLMAGNIEAYRHHLQGTGKEGLLVDSWYVNVFRGKNRPNLKDLAWKLRLDRNAPVEVIGQQELRTLEPHLSADCSSAVIIRDQARALSPGGLCKALADKAAAMGAHHVRGEVTAIRQMDGGRIELTFAHCEPHTCSLLVLAGGIGSASFLKQLGLRMPLISERGYHVEFPGDAVRLNNSILDVAGKFVVSSMTGGTRAAGTSEFASPEAPVDRGRLAAIERQARGLLPGLSADRPVTWMGIRPSFPDNLPAIGPLPGHRNVIAAFGHSQYGMGMAPATGRIVASIAAGEPDNSWPQRTLPHRFA